MSFITVVLPSNGIVALTTLLSSIAFISFRALAFDKNFSLKTFCLAAFAGCSSSNNEKSIADDTSNQSVYEQAIRSMDAKG